MFQCKDVLVDFLKGYGYQLIALPRTNIHPLNLLERVDATALRKIGRVEDLFKRGGSASIPRLRRDIPAPKALNGKNSSSLHLGLGLQLAADFLAAFGAKAAGLHGAYKNAEILIFSYKDILVNEIDLIPLDEYINEAIINSKAKTYTEALKKGRIFIITSTLKSNNFSIKAIDKNNKDVKIKIPEIQSMIEGKIQVSVDRGDESQIQFHGDENLVFAFQAVQIMFIGEQEGFRLKTQDNVILRDESDITVRLYKSKRNFITIHEE